MKRLWLAGGLLAAVVAICVSALSFQRQQVTALCHTLDTINKAVEAEDTATAYTIASRLVEDYDRRTALFPCFMSHDELVACRESVQLLPSILQDGSAEEFHMESARCRAHLERLVESERPSWQNIL